MLFLLRSAFDALHRAHISIFLSPFRICLSTAQSSQHLCSMCVAKLSLAAYLQNSSMLPLCSSQLNCRAQPDDISPRPFSLNNLASTSHAILRHSRPLPSFLQPLNPSGGRVVVCQEDVDAPALGAHHIEPHTVPRTHTHERPPARRTPHSRHQHRALSAPPPHRQAQEQEETHIRPTHAAVLCFQRIHDVSLSTKERQY